MRSSMENGAKKDENDEEFRDLTKIGGQQPIFYVLPVLRPDIDQRLVTARTSW